MRSEPAFSPAAERNKQAILELLLQLLPASGTALEIASGSGQHVAWFAQRLPQWTWQPTDADAPAVERGHKNLEPAADLPQHGRGRHAAVFEIQ